EDLNKPNFDKVLDGKLFDAVVIDDVLEHLEKPKTIVLQATKLLKSGGYLITSLPNNDFLPVAFLRKISPFFKMNNGPLDFTHQHFYYLKPARRLYNGRKNLKLIEKKATPPPLPEIITPIALAAARLVPYYFGYQTIFVHQKELSLKI
ncbi:MAG: methyltransferase domain-containing protein, partial [Patescibacteria group bacterium]